MANRESHDVTVISATQVIATLPVGGNPSAVGVNPLSGYAYLTSWADGVAILSGTQVVTTVAAGASPAYVGVDPYAGRAYVGNVNSRDVTVIEGTAIVGTVPLAGWPQGIGVHASPVHGGYAYVSNGPQSIAVLSGTTTIGTVTLAAGSFPGPIGVNQTSGYAYAIHEAGHSYTVTAVRGLAAVRQLTVGREPIAVAASPLQLVYVANHSGHSVTLIYEAFTLCLPLVSRGL